MIPLIAVEGRGSLALRRTLGSAACRRRGGCCRRCRVRVDRPEGVAFMIDGAGLAERWASLLERDRVRSPSIVVGVFDRRGLLWSHGEGSIRLPQGPRPDEGTVYRIASMSKSFCAAVMMILVERGMVTTSTCVRDVLPSFRDYRDAGGVTVPVTIGMLLSMTSGLAEDNEWSTYRRRFTHDDLLLRISQGLRFTAPPGERFQYSNLSYSILGLVVETLTGMTYPDAARTLLFDPLKLTATRFDVRDYAASDGGVRDGGFPGDGTPGVSAPDVAVGYGPDGLGDWSPFPYTKKREDADAAAGGVFSTVADIARWSGWLSRAFDPMSGDGGSGDGGILSMSSRRRMQIPMAGVESGSAGGGARPRCFTGYGYGLFGEVDGKHDRFAFHSGGLPGFSSVMRWHLDSGLGVVAFANSDRAGLSSAASDLLDEALSLYEGETRPAPVWGETYDYARIVDDVILGTRGVEGLSGLLASNLFFGTTPETRIEEIRRRIRLKGGLCEHIRPFRERMAWSRSAAELTWSVPCMDGPLYVSIQLTPFHDTRIQRIAVMDDGELEGSPLRSFRRFSVVVPQSALEGSRHS